MTSTPRFMRPLLFGAVVLALASASGCSWFKHKSTYTQSVENRPLEVPPDLDLPDLSASTPLPSAVGPSIGAAKASADIHLDHTATVEYPLIGKALESIEGVIINGRAEIHVPQMRHLEVLRLVQRL